MTLDLRVGQGFDAHPLRPGRRCVLAGVEIESPVGPEGHSDGDVVLHALTDALLGAFAAGDIGSVFGTTHPEWKDAASSAFVEGALELTGRPRIVNVDVTIVGAVPRVAPHVAAMRARLGELLALAPDRVSVKASTGNGLGEMGRGEGISAWVVLLAEAPAAA